MKTLPFMTVPAFQRLRRVRILDRFHAADEVRVGNPRFAGLRSSGGEERSSALPLPPCYGCRAAASPGVWWWRGTILNDGLGHQGGQVLTQPRGSWPCRPPASPSQEAGLRPGASCRVPSTPPPDAHHQRSWSRRHPALVISNSAVNKPRWHSQSPGARNDQQLPAQNNKR